MLGLIDDLGGAAARARGSRAGESIVVLGETRAELGGSEWAAVVHGLDGGAPPVADLDAAARLHALVADLVRAREVTGVHDVSDGGLAVALCEMAFGGDTGFRVDLADRARRAVVHRGRGRVRRVDVAGGRGGRAPSRSRRSSARPRPPAFPPR